MLSIRTWKLAGPAFAALASLNAGAALAAEKTEFTISIESVTTAETLTLPDGTFSAAPLSPGLFAISKNPDLLFTRGEAAGPALERLAEDGDAAPLIAALNGKASAEIAFSFLHDQPFTFRAEPGDRLHFAVMFAQSNDVFLAPRASGIELFDRDGRPVSGDVTGAVVLWDAGTEVNQPPGAGVDQAPRQRAPNIGTDENGVIHVLSDGYGYPAVANVIRVTIVARTELQTSRS